MFAQSQTHGLSPRAPWCQFPREEQENVLTTRHVRLSQGFILVTRLSSEKLGAVDQIEDVPQRICTQPVQDIIANMVFGAPGLRPRCIRLGLPPERTLALKRIEQYLHRLYGQRMKPGLPLTIVGIELRCLVIADNAKGIIRFTWMICSKR
ncbi:MAG: hypothetical protein QM639_07660 [Rhodocyclaceae bacterium]